LNPQENAIHCSIDILGMSSNIPSHPVDEKFGNTNNRAATYFAEC
jgi:hypothetical protein